MNVCANCRTPIRGEERFCGNCGMPVTSPTSEDPSPASLHPGERPRVSLPKLLAGSVTLLAVLVGGLLGFRFLFPGGGADTPEEALTVFVESLAQQDSIGALRMVNPGEVAGLEGIMSALQKRIADTQLASSGEGTVMDALTVEVQNLKVDVDEESETLAHVTLESAELHVTLDSDKLPERYAALATRYPDGETWDIDISEALTEELTYAAGSGEERIEPFATAVEVGGRWYLSPTATVAEYVVRAGDLDSPDYDVLSEDPLEPVIGDDPEEAAENVVDAVSSGDPEELLATLPSDQFDVLRAYVEVVEDAMDEYSVDLSADMSRLNTDLEEVGDLTKMTFETLKIETSVQTSEDSGNGALTIDDACLEVSGEGETCIEDRFADLTGVDSWYVMLSEQDGGYQVDPLATLVSYGRQFVENTPEDVILRALDVPGMIAPAGSLEVGTLSSIQLGDSGMAVAEVAAEQGQILAVTSQTDDVGFEWYGPDRSVNESAWDNVILAEETGTYRLLVEGADDFEPGEVQVQVDAMVPKRASAEDELAPFPDMNAGAYRVELNGEYTVVGGDVSVLDQDGHELYDVEGQSLAGTYTVVVLGGAAASLNEVVMGFEGGGTTYYTTVYGDASVQVNLVAGTDVVIVGYSRDDISLELDGSFADSGFSGDSELLLVSPSYTGTYTLNIHNFSDNYGDVELSLETP